MCGINGIYNFSGSNLPGSRGLVDSMNRCIAHRGPDDEGYYGTENLHLGHRRLSIIDLSPAGHQPMTDDKDAIVFNGEIYNYRDLKKSIAGETFRGDSDTEVLLKLLKNKGTDALQLLNGMFAFAWWNSKEEKLYLVRDRIGKKPVYYCNSNGRFAFSSEIRSLLQLPWIKPEVNEESLYHFLTFNQVSAPGTMFRNIYKLPPASLLVIGSDGVEKVHTWWDVEYSSLAEKTEDAIAERVRNELEKSVGLRMVADVPVGAFLSGGVDSSAIVAYMSHLGHRNIKTYSVGFSDQPDYTELKYAEKIAKKYNTEHYEKVVKPEDIESLLPSMAEIFDDPLADATSIPIWFISKLAKENGTIVVQTGDGSDEIFSGYRNWARYAQLYPYYHLYKKLPSAVKKAVASLSGDEFSPRTEILQRAVRNEEFFWGGAKAFKEHTKRSFLTPEFTGRMQDIHSWDVLKKIRIDFEKHQQKHQLGDVDWMCYLGVKQQIPERYLYRMDRLGMANSIEIRSPFLDYNLVNYALSVPSEWKLKNDTPKYILKKALEGILDHDTLYRKKMGFCVPLREWGGSVMVNYVKENLDRFCSETGVFRKEGLTEIVKNTEQGNESMTNQLYTVYFLMAWYDRWIF